MESLPLRETSGEPEERPVNRLTETELIALERRYNENEDIHLPTGERMVINDLRPMRETGTPVVFVPGYYAEGDSFKGPMLDLALSGRRVLTYNAYHGIDTTAFRAQYAAKIAELQRRDPQTDIEPQLRKTAALITLLEEKNLRCVDVFGHSEGAIVATIAAYLRPDLFQKKVFLNPAGLISPTAGKFGMSMGVVLDNLNTLGTRIERTVAGEIACFRDWVGQLLSMEGKALRPPQMDSRRVSKRYYALSVVQSDAEALKAEYRAGEQVHLDREFTAVTTRKLERWLPLLDQNVIIGTGTDDRLFPSSTVRSRARKGGVTQFITIQGAGHNVQHYEPGKVSTFLCKALGIGPHEVDEQIALLRTMGN